MGKDEIKYVLITGQSPKWVGVTKGLITGKITLNDLIVAELLDQEQAAELAAIMVSEGKDPQSELIYDVDWIIRVETGSMAEVDTEKELQSFDTAVQFGTQYRLPLDIKKLWIERATKAGLKEPESYLLQNGGQNGQDLSAPAPTGAQGGVPAMAGPSMPAGA